MYIHIQVCAYTYTEKLPINQSNLNEVKHDKALRMSRGVGPSVPGSLGFILKPTIIVVIGMVMGGDSCKKNASSQTKLKGSINKRRQEAGRWGCTPLILILNTQEVEVGGSLRTQGQAGRQNKFHDSQGYT